MKRNQKIRNGMEKTRSSFSEKLNNIFKAFRRVDEDLLEELEEDLILSDMGYATTEKIIDTLRDTLKEKNIKDPEEVRAELISIITDLVRFDTPEENFPRVVMMVGVNGVGKTTSIGKIAYAYKQEGKSVLMAAADTFRAAAAEQLSIWAERAGVPIVKYAEGYDPAAVVYDAIDSAKHRGTDVVIVDTAGRLHNKKNLMDELEKINRVIGKAYPEAERETLLVLDATTGQNAVAQAKEFMKAAHVDALVLTKLDGTAKGGVVCAIKEELGIPVKYIGVGEGIDDLKRFDAEEFAEALFC